MTKAEWLKGVSDAISSESLEEIEKFRRECQEMVDEVREHDEELALKIKSLVEDAIFKIVDIRNYLKVKHNDPSP